MGWNIRVWHEMQGDQTRLCIEAGAEVPDDVISSVAGSYWLEEVQYTDEDWDEPEELGGQRQTPTPRLQG